MEKRGSTDTKADTVHPLTTDVTTWDSGDAWCPVTTPTTTLTTSRRTTQTTVPTTGTTREWAPLLGLPRGKRLKHGNGPRVFARDSGTQGLGHTMDKIEEAGLATEAKTGQCEGRGTGHKGSFHQQALSPCEDSRLNLSRIGLRPLLGGDVVALTPFPFSPMMDTSVGCLPELFLAYCTLADTFFPDSCPDNRAIPDMMADDPMPLLSLHSSH